MSENEQPNLRGEDPERRKDAFADDDVEGHIMKEGPEGGPGFIASAKDDDGEDSTGRSYMY